jgi:hypothetical protein
MPFIVVMECDLFLVEANLCMFLNHLLMSVLLLEIHLSRGFIPGVASFYDLFIWFWNCSDSVPICFVSHFINLKPLLLGQNSK